MMYGTCRLPKQTELSPEIAKSQKITKNYGLSEKSTKASSEKDNLKSSWFGSFFSRSKVPNQIQAESVREKSD